MELRLPPEYQEVEYIENTGTQYIITDLLFPKDLENPKIEWGFMQIAVPSGDNMVFGYWSNGSIYYEVYNSTTLSYASIGKNHYDRISNSNLTKDMFIAGVMTKETMYLNGYSYVKNAEDTIDQSVRTMAIFAWNSSSGRTYTNKGARIYYLRFFDGNTKMADYVPCYRKSDGEIGMYDTVTKTFYTNSGTGTFLKGADITRYIDNVSVLDTRRKILLNTPHIDTSVGDLVTFNTDLSAPLKNCKVSFLPVQEGEGDPSPDNVREITGWNGVEGYKCGKNMAHIVGYSAKGINEPYADRNLTNNYGTTINTTEPINEIIVTQSTWNDSKNKHHYTNGYFCIIDDNLIFGQRYKCSFKITNITNNPLNSSLSDICVISPKGSSNNAYIDGDYIYSTFQYLPHPSILNRHGIEIRNCGMSFTMSDFMVTAVDNDDFTYESYQGTTTSIDWTDEAGTIYRGHLDLINGVLTATWVKIHLTSSYIDGFGATNTAPYRAYTKQISGAKRYDYPNFTNNIICDKIAPMAVGTKDLWYPYEYIGYINNSGRFVFGLSSEQSTKDLAKQWIDAIGGLDLCYELAEPVTYQLTPQQLTTLRGINNIWSSANGEVEIKYWKH